MIVLDASATVEMLLGTPTGHAVRRRVVSHQVNAPHLLAVEVTQALRRLASSGAVAEEVAGFCLRDFGALLIRRWRHEPFLARAWELSPRDSRCRSSRPTPGSRGQADMRPPWRFLATEHCGHLIGHLIGGLAVGVDPGRRQALVDRPSGLHQPEPLGPRVAQQQGAVAVEADP
jgi:hypothetical protein